MSKKIILYTVQLIAGRTYTTSNLLYKANGVSFTKGSIDGYGGNTTVRLFVPYSNIKWIEEI